MPQSGGLIALQEVKLVEFGRKRRLLLNLMRGGMRGGGGRGKVRPAMRCPSYYLEDKLVLRVRSAEQGNIIPIIIYPHIPY